MKFISFHLIILLSIITFTFGESNNFEPLPSFGGTTNLYPTVPGTSFRDYSKPGMKIEKSTYGRGADVYSTVPGTPVRDYSKPGMKIEKSTYRRGTDVYPTIPGTSLRDYSKPGWRIEK